jgi:hypothetical protein
MNECLTCGACPKAIYGASLPAGTAENVALVHMTPKKAAVKVRRSGLPVVRLCEAGGTAFANDVCVFDAQAILSENLTGV